MSYDGEHAVTDLSGVQLWKLSIGVVVGLMYTRR